MRNKTRVQTARLYTRKIHTQTRARASRHGEEKINKSLLTVFDYFSKSTDEVSERFSADLLL